MSKLEGFDARRILDSRGQWTVEVVARDSDGNVAKASVPQGKSRGIHEAHTLSADDAVKSIAEKILPHVRGSDVSDQVGFDEALIELDGTTTKEELGGNAMLAVSIAVARLGAKHGGVPLWQYIRETARLESPKAPPRLFANLINGGVHADNGLRFQEYMAIPKERAIKPAIETVCSVYAELSDVLAKTIGSGSTRLGDEGGFAPDMSDDERPFDVLVDVLENLGLSNEVDFGIDAAAGTIDSTNDELGALYKSFVEKYPLKYIEDPFGEEEFDAFAQLKDAMPENVRIVGDDLTVSNVSRINIAQEYESISAIIIKPNQIGTVSEAVNATLRAKGLGWHIVASHRSGETNDDFIADFAYGVGADGFKLGAPARGERVQKYNRLLEIVEEDKL